MAYLLERPAERDMQWVLHREWLETNGLGDYSSSTLLCCNTRKYHGLLTVNLDGLEGRPAGRHVLLSNLEDSLEVTDKTASKDPGVKTGEGARFYQASSRRHPGVYYPEGHKALREISLRPVPAFLYHFKDGGYSLLLRKELMLVPGKHLFLVRYLLEVPAKDLPLSYRLRVNPLLAFRGFHTLMKKTEAVNTEALPLPHGFSTRPFENLPGLVLEMRPGRPLPCAENPIGKPVRRVRIEAEFEPSPDWYYACLYEREAERGFEAEEDLFCPGGLSIRMRPGVPVYLSAGLAPFNEYYPKRLDTIEKVWQAGVARRKAEDDNIHSLAGYLAREGKKFIVDLPGGKGVIAGYHWFDAWGRDSFIALAGLASCSGRRQEAFELLARAGKACKGGLIPNIFGPDGKNHAYNSADASLWYLHALQQFIESSPDRESDLSAVFNACWPAVKEIVGAYSQSAVTGVRMDSEGFLHVGDSGTQLTWMDAVVDGRPVTPRNGCPVEISALWFNALLFTQELADIYGEIPPTETDVVKRMPGEFTRRFLINGQNGRYLADVWNENGTGRDLALRPNQLFSVGLPKALLEARYHREVFDTVTASLLTPFGLRTLAPADPDYRGKYGGSPSERDGAYHQGTVWPWLLGIYTDAMLKVSLDAQEDARHLLNTLTPLFTRHLSDAGVGSISEIFGGDAPYPPDGCIAQAWSVAEVLRALLLIKNAAPKAYADWEVENIMAGEHTQPVFFSGWNVS